MTGFILFIVSLLSLAAVYALLSLALNLEAGVDGLWDLGIVAFFSAGAYVYVILTGGPPKAFSKYLLGFDLPMPVGILAAGGVGVLLAYLIGKPTLRIKNEYFLITTLAFSEVLRQVYINESWLTNGVAGRYRLAQPLKQYFSPAVYPYVLLTLLAIAVVVTYFVIERLTKGHFGRSLRALRENEDLAVTAGISPVRFHQRAFMVTGFFAGVAGPLYVWFTTVCLPTQFTSNITFFAWTAVVIGGIGRNLGAVVGAILLILLGELLGFVQVSSSLANTLASLRIVLVGVVMVVILRWRPKGIIPERETKFLVGR